MGLFGRDTIPLSRKARRRRPFFRRSRCQCLVAAALLFVCFRFFFLTPKKEVDIVVVTFNAFIYAKQGLETLKRNTDWQKARLHLVDSGSNTESLSWFEEFCESWFCRFSTRGDVGYTRAANYGVKQGVRKLVVLMNPDVLVCSSWLENLIKAMNTCPMIAAVGPHSNAASFQSIPDIFDEDGNLARNDLPDGLHVEDMCRMVQSKTFHDFPDTTFLNGFLMLFKRSAFDAVGGLDDTNFPIGYGEENDFCIRLQNAGYSLAVADNTYAYHFKTTGFSQERRVELSRNGSLENRAKHGKVFFDAHIDFMKSHVVRFRTRAAVSRELLEYSRLNVRDKHDPMLRMKIIFLLPVQGAGGGVISIVQITKQLQKFGVDAKIAIKTQYVDFYDSHFNNIGELPLFEPYSDHDELLWICQDADSVVATIFTSVATVLSLMKDLSFTPAYFIQDYEVLFSPVGSTAYEKAVESYNLAKYHGLICFAKTRWIVDTIKSNHGLHVHLVTPSLDQEKYAKGICRRSNKNVLHIAGMVRTSTPRRSPLLTLKVLGQIKSEYGQAVHITIFGSSKQDIKKLEKVQSISHSRSFDENKELIDDKGVADLMRNTDIFVDLSVYQAFGRTAVECMASHCIPVVPKLGGAAELVNDGGGIAVDTSDILDILVSLRKLVRLPEREKRIMALRASTKVSFMSNEKAAFDVLNLLLRDAYSDSKFLSR